MSQDICITKTKTYGPPCFIDGNGQPNCEYKVTECGISLENIVRNEETERLFQAAARTGHRDILSDEDIHSQVSAELRGFVEPSEVKRILEVSVRRFKQDAASPRLFRNLFANFSNGWGYPKGKLVIPLLDTLRLRHAFRRRLPED